MIVMMMMMIIIIMCSLHILVTVNTEQLQHPVYTRNTVCFRYVIVNTLHKGDNNIIIILALRHSTYSFTFVRPLKCYH